MESRAERSSAHVMETMEPSPSTKVYCGKRQPTAAAEQTQCELECQPQANA